ncbi:MAG: hypothetical protein U0T82_11915 [Bacteroidales bacterium]
MRKELLSSSLALVSVLFLCGCEKEPDYEKQMITYSSEQIAKIQLCYNYVENMRLAESSGEKIESDAPDNYISIDINNEINRIDKSPRIPLKSFGQYTVGVIKSGSCGSYQEVDVFLDCEDDSPSSTTSGWVGDNTVDANKNVMLRFCAVPCNNFVPYTYPYAVLRLGFQVLPTDSYGSVTYQLKRKWDTEDNNNKNAFYYTGTPDPNLPPEWPNVNDGNWLLYFLMYKGNPSGTFPYFGISYGVFGTIADASQRGYVRTDDEDNNNANWMRLQTLDALNNYAIISDVVINKSSTTYEGIINHNSDTRLYCSKIY